MTEPSRRARIAIRRQQRRAETPKEDAIDLAMADRVLQGTAADPSLVVRGARPDDRYAELLKRLDLIEPEVDCGAGLHDPRPILASTSRTPLGYRCGVCGERCDENGKPWP